MLCALVPPALEQPRRRVISLHTALVIAAALGMACVSAYFSVSGLTAIFVGAPVAVLALGAALEVGKLATASVLPHLRWGPLKIGMAVLVGILVGLNALGAFGYCFWVGYTADPLPHATWSVSQI